MKNFVLKYFLEIFILIKLSEQFSCEHDGIFEDVENCRMYYECSWIGTVLEKVDHMECPEDSYFNPKYHRCENIGEFEYRLGEHTDEIEEDEIIRYKNCIGKLETTTTTTTTTLSKASTTTTLTSTTVTSTLATTTNLPSSTAGTTQNHISNTKTEEFGSYKVLSEPKTSNNSTNNKVNDIGLIFLTSDENIIVQSGNKLKEKLLDLIPNNLTVESPKENESNSIDILLNRKKLVATFKTLKEKHRTEARLPHLHDFFNAGYQEKSNDPLVSEVKLEKIQTLRKRRILSDDVIDKIEETLLPKSDSTLTTKNSTLSSTKNITLMTSTTQVPLNQMSSKKKLNFVKALRKIDNKFTEIMLTRNHENLNLNDEITIQTSKPTETPKNFTIIGKKSFNSASLDKTLGSLKAYKSGNLSYIVPLNRTKIFGKDIKSQPYILVQNETNFNGRNGKLFNTIQMQPSDTLIECKDNDFGLECSCSTSLSPPKCKQLINTFLSSCRVLGCKNNGRCINMANKFPIPYMCSCPSTHYGSYCEISRYNDYAQQALVKLSTFTEPICQPNPCHNSGKCEIVSDSVQCNCGPYFTGKFCENLITTQMASTTSTKKYELRCPNDCSMHGKCVISLRGYPICKCEKQWSGIDCSEANYCFYNDCMNNSTCINLPHLKSYSCKCNDNYSGNRCEVIKTNIYQQQVQQVVPYNYPNGNPCGSVKCLNNGTCVLSFSHARNKFSFICKCPVGYSGSLCEIKNDPCESNPCRQPGAICRSIDTYSYKCMCNQFECPPMFPKFGNLIALNTTQIKKDICKSDSEICKKYPHGNESFICIRHSPFQEAQCINTELVNCKSNNPCLNDGKCLTNYGNHNWKCLCSDKYTGRLCETELCSKVYRSMINHTMCLPNSANFISGEVNYTNINLILKTHNEARRNVFPLASNMQKMYWDNELQHLAQKRAQMCTVDSQRTLFKKEPAFGMIIGENIAAGLDNWNEALSSWTNESKYFSYNKTFSANLKAGHYTQVANF